jgi:hypothetical protein
MKRFVVLGSAVILAACGSSSAPKDIFSGTWDGAGTVGSQTLLINTTTTQSGSAVSGICTGTGGGNTLTCTLTGTSSPPSVTFTMTFHDALVITFTGNYVSRDSVAGILTEQESATATDTIPGFGFKKQ